jgi:hypothetical protein
MASARTSSWSASDARALTYSIPKSVSNAAPTRLTSSMTAEPEATRPRACGADAASAIIQSATKTAPATWGATIGSSLPLF